MNGCCRDLPCCSCSIKLLGHGVCCSLDITQTLILRIFQILVLACLIVIILHLCGFLGEQTPQFTAEISLVMVALFFELFLTALDAICQLRKRSGKVRSLKQKLFSMRQQLDFVRHQLDSKNQQLISMQSLLVLLETLNEDEDVISDPGQRLFMLTAGFRRWKNQNAPPPPTVSISPPGSPVPSQSSEEEEEEEGEEEEGKNEIMVEGISRTTSGVDVALQGAVNESESDAVPSQVVVAELE